MGRIFRNEGMDTKHNPEFTTCELYQAYTNLDGMMDILEGILTGAAKEILGTYHIPVSYTHLDVYKRQAEGEVTACAQENLTAVRVVRAFGREKYEEDKFQAKSERYAGLWIHLGKLLSVYWASGTLLTCLQVMVIILAGIHESVAGAMTLGAFVAFVSYNESLAWPVRSLGRVLSDMSKAGVSMDLSLIHI